jgi:uncharacterized phiE125 gp8 family phage protein
VSESLTLVSAPASEPFALDDAKTHLKVDVTTDDELISTLLIAARELCETVTHRAFITQTWDYKLDAFPTCDELWLPKPPVSSVTSISCVDGTGTTQTWGASYYRLDAPTGPHARRARITPAYGVVYPSTQDVTGAVTVRFVCGYGGAAAVPSSIKAAMKLLIGHWYENRESVNVGNIVNVMPQAADALLWPFKAF